jgi:hypothetical protein
MTVTYNGQVSATQPIKVVKSSVGIFAINQAGSGPAVVTDANYKVITQTNPARPGQVLIIWATGAGPVSFDETQPPTTAVNIQSEAKAHVLVGGTDVTPSFVGRSGCCSGLDQIIFTVPQGVSGCYVSLAVQTDDPVVSNFGTIAVAPTGNATCSDPNGLSAQDFATLQSTGTLRSGFLGIGRGTFTTPSIAGVPATTATTDIAYGAFSKYDLATFTKSQGLFRSASIGSCVVFTFSGQNTQTTDPTKATPLDAGTPIDLSGPGLTAQLTQPAGFPGSYNATIQGDPLAAGGAFTFTGHGGADVGAFTATVNASPALTWTNKDQISTVTETAGQLITWTGGDPNGTVQITGGSSSGIETPIVGGSFICTEKNSAKQFNIPAAVLLTLPAEPADSLIPFGNLNVSSQGQLVKFTATGLDFGFALAYDSTGKSVSYK